jgi:hypothetical protein
LKRAGSFQQTSGAMRRENANVYLPSLRGALATKQSTLTFVAARWIASLRSQ